MAVNAEDTPIPAATTYSYKKQRNVESRDERIALEVGYIATTDLLTYLRASVGNRIEDGRPNIIQAFVPTMQLKNHVYRVQWGMSHMQMLKITNKIAITDQRYSLQSRTVTAEDLEDNNFCEYTPLPNQGKVYERLLRAMLELHNHVKKNSEIAVTGGNFYFKFDTKDRPFLLFGTQIKTERPIPILNSKLNFVLVPGVHHIIERRDPKKPKRNNVRQAQQYKRLLEDTSLPELGRDDSDVVIGGVQTAAGATIQSM